MNKLYILGAFVGGAAVGATASWLLLKTKYEQYAQEEIDSVKEIYSSRKVEMECDDEELNEQLAEIEQLAKEKMEEIVNREGYATKKKHAEKVEKKEEDDVEKPYVISPEEFDENGYNTITLTYYADKKLVDDAMEEEVEDVDELIGLANLETFGQYEDDSVFVRNDKTKTDYEILLDIRKWSDVNGDGE